jgi:hypothetical protein
MTKSARNQTDLRPGYDQAERFAITLGGNGRVAEKIQHPEGGPENRLIVINDEHGRPHSDPRCPLRTNQSVFGIVASDLGARQIDLHRGALADARLDSHPALRLFGETEDLRQSEARFRARFLGGEKRLEPPGQISCQTSRPASPNAAGCFEARHLAAQRRLLSPKKGT